MKTVKKFLLTAILCMVAAVCLTVTSFAASNSNGKWIAAWGTGPTNVSLKDYGNIAFVAKDLTARTVITPTASGDKIRIRFSNYYGKQPLTLENVTVANCVQADSIDPNDATSEIVRESMKMVTFNNNSPIVTIPAGKEVYSDEISFKVTALKNIAISYYAKDAAEIRTMGLSGGTTFLSYGGNKTQESSFKITQSFNFDIDDNILDLISTLIPGLSFDIPLAYKIVRVVPCLAGVDVRSDKNAYSIAVVGDSTVSNEYPLYLAEQINACGVKNVGVMGKGIIGNMLAGEEESLGSNLYGESLLKRFKQDIQSQTRIKYVIVKIGANDIIHPVCGENADPKKQPTANQLISSLKTICKMSHDMGAKVILCTITQWKGTTRDYFGAGASYDRTAKQFQADWKIATDVNKWIKSASNTYHDGYIDFVGISGDPKDSQKFNSNYSNDLIHPNDLLQKIWAENTPLGLLGVTKKVGSIKLNVSTKNLYMTKKVGDTGTIKVSSIIPSDAAKKTVHWKTSDSSVVDIVSQTGSSVKIIAKKPGKATIKAISDDGGATASCTVYVKTHVESVSLKKSVTLYTRQKVTLKPTISPSNADNKSVKWSTNNSKVATVNSSGVVTAVGAGKAVITCTTNDSAKKASCTVTVKKPVNVSSVKTNVTSKTIYVGSTYKLTATVLPSSATFKTVKWTSENSKIAKVDSNGLVTAVGAGTTYIVCKSTDNPTAVSRVKITVKIKATGLSISPSKTSVYVGNTKALSAVFKPNGAAKKDVTWKSLDKSIATVNANGVVKGVKAGTVVIECKTADGTLSAKCTVTVKTIVKVSKVTLNASSKNLKVGSTFTLKATVTPADAADKTLKWQSSNTSVATVNSKGVVKAIKAGSATITCTAVKDNKKATCKINVSNVTPESVKLNKTSVSIKLGSSCALKATVAPSNAANKKVKWQSSNTSVATVSASGVVKALKIGSATITCTTVSGAKKATCKVTVIPVKVSKVTLNKSSVNIDYGKTYKLTATVSPSNATNKKVAWSSSNTKVATVDSNGVVKAIKKGEATIYCRPTDGGTGEIGVCKVTVTKVNVIGVSMSDSSIRMQKGATYTILAKVLPDNASIKGLKWESTNPKVATVDRNGKVTAVGKGVCRVRAIAKDGNAVGSCVVTVID